MTRDQGALGTRSMSMQPRSRLRAVCAPIVAAVLLVATAVSAAPGDLDTSFSRNGMRTIDTGGEDVGYAVLVQADGRIVVGGDSGATLQTGDFGLVRLMASGRLDTSFAADGITTFDFLENAGYDRVQSLAQQADGSIVAVGFTIDPYVFAVARLLPDGSLDPSFSDDGKAMIQVPGVFGLVGRAVAVQPDGKILVGGEALLEEGDFEALDFAVARLEANGSLDLTYGGGDGLATTDFGSATDHPQTMALQSDGKLVVGGWSRPSGSRCRPAFARYDASGTPDPTFSSDGKLTLDMARTTTGPGGLAVRSDGRIVAAFPMPERRSARVDDPYAVGLVRIGPDGKLDPTFSGDGKLRSAPVLRGVRVVDMDLAAGNRLVVTADALNGQGFFLARYKPTGVLDGTFGGGDGEAGTRFPGSGTARAAAIQANGRIVVAGWALPGNVEYDFAVARYLP